MPPTGKDKYTILLKTISESKADTSSKELAATIVRLAKVLNKLISNTNISLDKISKGNDKSVDVLSRTLDKRLTKIEQVMSVISTFSKKLSELKGGSSEELLKAIKLLVKETRSQKREFSQRYNPETISILKELTRNLSVLNKSSKGEPTAAQLKKQLYDIINGVLRKDIEKLTKAVVDLKKSIGYKEAGSRAIRQPNVEVGGKIISQLGSDIDKILKDFSNKIIVLFDLETSRIEKRLEQSVKHVRQIGYQKGTLQDIIKGTTKKGNIYLKPPENIQKLYKEGKIKEAVEEYSKFLGDLGKATVDLSKELKRIMESGKDIKDALTEFVAVLKDSSAVMGHNIANFDLKVLNDLFKKFGVKLDGELSKYIDTLALSRKYLPGRQSHSLESFNKDFKAAGIKIKKVGEGMHDAAQDTEVARHVFLASIKGTKEFSAAQINLSNIINVVSDELDKLSKSVKKVASVTEEFTKQLDDTGVETKGLKETLKKAKDRINKASLDIKDVTTLKSGLQTFKFKELTVKPSEQGMTLHTPPGVPGMEKTAAIVNDLSKSLYKLQNIIVDSLKKGLKSGMQILADEAGNAFQLAKGGREYEVKIANIKDLRSELERRYNQVVSKTASPQQLISAFKHAFVREQLSKPVSTDVMAEKVAVQLRSMGSEEVSGLGRTVMDLYKGIKAGKIGVQDIATRKDLGELYKNIVLENEAQQRLNERFIRRVAIPAVKISSQGIPTIETKYGSQKIVSNFATITTGLERLVKEFELFGGKQMDVLHYKQLVSEIPLRFTPGGPEEAKANKLAAELINKTIKLGGKSIIREGYQKAIAIRKLETGEFSPKKARDYLQTQKSLEEVRKEADKLKISALEVAKALDSINFENFYDVLSRMLTKGKDIPFLERQAAKLGRFDESVRRSISAVVNELQGLLPLAEPGRVKRAPYQENLVRVFTKARINELRPEEQKKAIIETNLLWKDIVDRAKKLQEPLVPGKEYLGRPLATSLDLSDAASSELNQFNKDFESHVKELNKTMMSLSTADVRRLAPFKEFSSIQRQMSYVTAALGGGVITKKGIQPLETPRLLSEKERKLITSGKYGEGYGLNVLTELRQTAGTFEDQIMISGRLAKTFTKLVKNLVAPAEKIAEEGIITELKPGVQRLTPRAAEFFGKDLKDVVDKFQTILGVPKRYRGRADLAEIGKEIVNVIREHRGESIEVQTAKLTEYFLNYFGRKFSTRFGTKGVSIAVKPGEALGYAKIKKSAGELLSELLFKELKKIPEEFRPEIKALANDLKKYGNAFMIELFTDAEHGIVTPDVANKLKNIFDKVADVFKDLFGKELKPGITGLEEIQNLYLKQFGGKRELYKKLPIEARISSRGIAKRGLMTEVLEGIVNNLIGPTATTPITIKDVIPKEAFIESKKGREKINKYLGALGFEKLKDFNEVIKNLKLEKPNIDPETIKKLREFEKQWSVYTEVTDEFGKKIQSFVAPKFLQIVEEPNIFKDWSLEEISKGLKGLKLDYQSFAAYMDVFGEGSSMIKELAKSISLASREGLELIKAFQLLDPKMKDFRESLLKSLPEVTLKDVKVFEKSTGSLKDFEKTIFDISKFPTAFKLKIPTTEKGATKAYEELYIPGAAIRKTYQEELLGKAAPTNLGRYLDNLINAAKKVEDLYKIATKGNKPLTVEYQQKFASVIKEELVNALTSSIKQFREWERRGATAEQIQKMSDVVDKFKSVLTNRTAPVVYQTQGAITEKEVISKLERTVKGPFKFSTVLGRIADLLVGPKPESLEKERRQYINALERFKKTREIPQEYKEKVKYYGGDFEKMINSFLKRIEEKRKAKTIFEIQLEKGSLDKLASSLGINIKKSIEDALNEAKESLSKAKVRYYTELGKNIIGKRKGIEEAFFRRVTPAITGKAVVALTDKTKELDDLLKTLSETKYKVHIDIPGFNKLIDKLKTLRSEHAKQLKRARELGLPVLREGEIGLPPGMAQKIKVRTGKQNEREITLANLIKKQKTFVESIRYPFTGTLSIQPHIAKLMKGLPSKYSIAVPGVPQLDLAELNKIIRTLREVIGLIPREKRVYVPKEQKSLIEQREEAWSKNTEAGAKRAKELTQAIEGLLKVINEATPKFTDIEQKLDFDGDALFIHTGVLKESRKEIEAHYKALQEDTTSVRTLFRSVFSAVKEGETKSLAEMAYIFSKKHPAEKGFGFLTKPYLREQVSNLKMPEVFKALFSYEDAAKNISKGTQEWYSAVKNWSKTFMKTEILPEVFRRFNAPPEVQESYLKKVEESNYGIIKSSNNLERKITDLAKELIRKQLWEKKYSDAIAGQLYKLHTGQTVEGISRLLRISEIETGFGKGLAGTGKVVAPPSKEFLAKWPKQSIVLGNKPVEEFAARMNEILRFIIQKGMDVKHAGVKAVGQIILENIGKKGGVKAIMDAIKKHSEDFSELLDFEQEIINEAKLRLGKLSTTQLKRELKLFEPQLNLETLTSNRKELISRITKHINLEATFEELFRQIERQAIKALIVSYNKQLKELPEGTTKARLQRDISAAGGLEELARQRVEKAAASEKGIAIPSTIVANLQPLYQMRTSMETLKSVAGRTKAEIPIKRLLLPAGEAGEEFAKKLEIATKAAHALSEAMEQAANEPTKGIHGIMVASALHARYKELNEIEAFVKKFSSIGETGGVISGPPSEQMLRSLLKTATKEVGVNLSSFNLNGIDTFISNINKVKRLVSEKISTVYEKAGLPPLMPQEEEAIKTKYMAQHSKRFNEDLRKLVRTAFEQKGEPYTKNELEQTVSYIQDKLNDFFESQAIFIEKLKRIFEVSKTIPFEKAYLKRAFLGLDITKPMKDYINVNKDVQEKTAATYSKSIDDIDRWYKKQQVINEVDKELKGQIDKSRRLQSAVVESYVELSDAISNKLIKDKMEALRALVKKAEGKTAGRQIELYKLYRASGLHGGGTYEGKGQLEAILGEMVGKPKSLPTLLELTSARGQFIHRQIQREFLQKYPKAEIEKPIEDFKNKITGHLDVLYEKSGQKIVSDIKTIYSQAQFKRLKEIANEIKQRKISIQDKLKELKSQDVISDIDKNIIRRLEDYLSQINVYLKNVEGAVGEILIVNTIKPEERFTIPVGKFDPVRFEKDIKLVEKARSKLENAINLVRLGEPIPKDLFKGMPELYDYISSKLKELGPEKFIEMLPKRPYGELNKSAREILDTLTKDEEEKGKKLSKELLDYYKRVGGIGGGAERKFKLWLSGSATGGGAFSTGGGGAVPPPPGGIPPAPPGGTSGGGFDDEYYKALKALFNKIKRGEELDIQEKLRLYKFYQQIKADIYTYSEKAGSKELVDNLIDILRQVEDAIQEAGISDQELNSFKRELDNFKKARSEGITRFDEFRKVIADFNEPHKPEVKHANLKVLFREAIRYYKLGDISEAKNFGPEIYKLIQKAGKEGPSRDLARQIREAIERLPQEKQAGMMRIWMLYKKEVGDYFLRRLDELKKKIEEAGTGPEAQRLYNEYEAVVDRYINNIEASLGKRSDIYTKAVSSGKKTEFVSPSVAALVGIYKTPEQLSKIISQRELIKPKYKPILQMLIGDLKTGELRDMLSPLEKVRNAFDLLTKLDPKLKALINDADLLRRKGSEIIDAWDFKTLLEGVTELRNSLEAYNRLAIGGFGGPSEVFTEEARKNLADTIKYLRQLEKSLSTIGAKSELNLINVPQFLAPQEQRLLHKRNIAAIREYFKKSQAEGGPPIGKAFTYRYKVIDPATKQALDSIAVEFKKIGEESVKAGHKIGIFTEKTDDLIKLVQGRRGFGQAFGRVIRWGVASRTVYGLVNAFKEMVNVISDVQTGMAVLRQVMSPLETNFSALQQSAVNFAKEFGLPIRQVIDSMRVFAQQGLSQKEVIDRTRSSLLAANVTTLQAEDATEALTAAVKVYGQEGESTIKFLDAWTQVESRHAITSKNLALALRKAAAAAKNAGVTFDQLNAVITGIGETTRQTGNEIGTSLRFIFRRLYTKKAPQQLATLGIPIIGETGELRSAFKILGDLADKWDELSSAQRMSIATAIGGRRHYNSIIVLMEHWSDVLDTLQDSVDSTGAAERRNAIIMETYSKKVQQLKAAIVELQLQFGKYALPIATKFATTLRVLIEAISNLSPAVKIGVAALGGFFLIVTKGQVVVNSLVDHLKSITSVFNLLKGDFAKKVGSGIFEVFGKVPDIFGNVNTSGLKVIGKSARSIRDLETVIGKFAYILAKVGRVWNEVVSNLSVGAKNVFGVVSKTFGGLGKVITLFVETFGLTSPVLLTLFSSLAMGAEAGEKAFEKLTKAAGVSAEAFQKWAQENTTFVKSFAPLAGSLVAAIPIFGKITDEFKRLTFSAEGYNKSLSGIRRKQSGELDRIGSLIKNYKLMERELVKVNKLTTKEAASRAISREEYISPILSYDKLGSQYKNFANEVAKSMPELVLYFDKFGNAVLRSGVDLLKTFELLRKEKLGEIADTQIKALEKFAEDLTNAGTLTSKFRSELKKFVKEVPAFGPIFSKLINVSPAQELKEAIDNMNKIISQRTPLSPAYQALFKTYYEELEKSRKRFKDNYKQFTKILSEIPEGISSSKLISILSKKTFRPMYEMIIEQRRSLRELAQKGVIDYRDILGIEVMKKIHPERDFDFAGPLTKELLRQAKIIERKGKIFAGDTVIFLKDIDKYVKAAGQVGVVKFKDGIGWVVELFDKELLKIREIPFSDVEKFVDSVFPAHRIVEAINRNLDIVKENLTGASAGMVGITQKEFRKLYNLGPQFFEQIPTEILLQTSKGFNIKTGKVGEVPIKKGFPAIIKQYTDLIDRLNQLIEEPAKRLQSGKGLSKGLEEEISKLQKLIVNNQVYLQFMRIYADLEKTIARTNRVTEENIAIENERNKVLVETNGLLKNVSTQFKNLDLGITDFSKLTTQQFQLFTESLAAPGARTFTNRLQQIREEQLRSAASSERLTALTKAREQINYIFKQSKAGGLLLSEKEISNFAEAVKAGITPLESKKLSIQSDIKRGVFKTVDKIDELNSTIMGVQKGIISVEDADKIFRSMTKQIKELSPALKPPVTPADVTAYTVQKIGENRLKLMFDRLVKLRGEFIRRGESEAATRVDELLKLASKQLVATVGIKKAIEIAGKNTLPYRIATSALGGVSTGIGKGPSAYIDYLYSGKFSKEELIGKVFDIKSLQEFIGKIEEGFQLSKRRAEIAGESLKLSSYTEPNRQKAYERFIENTKRELKLQALLNSKEFKALKNELQKQYKPSVVSSETLTKLFFTVSGISHVFKQASARSLRAYELQLKELREQRSTLKAQFKAGKITEKEYKKRIEPLNKKAYETAIEYSKARRAFKTRSSLEAISALGGALTFFARELGVSERQLKRFGGATVGLIAAWKLWSKLTGEKLPKKIDEAASKLSKAADDLQTGGKFTTTIKSYLPFTDLHEAKKAIDDVKKWLKSKGLDKNVFSKAEKDRLRKVAEDVKQGKDIKKDDVKQLSTQEAILKTNKDQLATMLAIEENTRTTANTAKQSAEFTEGAKKEINKNSNYAKELRDRLDSIKKEQLKKGGSSLDKLKDTLAGIILATAGGYLAQKSKLPNQLAIAADQQKKITNLLTRLFEKFPDEMSALLKTYVSEREKIMTTPGLTKEEQGIRIEEARRKLLAYIDSLVQSEEEYKKSNDMLISLNKEFERLTLIGAKVSKSLAEFFKSIRDSVIDLAVEFNYNRRTLGAAAGLPKVEELSRVKTPAELTPTEIMLKYGGPGLKKAYIINRSLERSRQGLLQVLKDTIKEGSDFAFTVKSYYNKWTDSYQKLLESQSQSSQKFSKLANEKLAKADKLSSIVDKINHDLEEMDSKDVHAREVAINMRKKLISRINKLKEEAAKYSRYSDEASKILGTATSGESASKVFNMFRENIQYDIAFLKNIRQQSKELRDELKTIPLTDVAKRQALGEALGAKNLEFRKQKAAIKEKYGITYDAFTSQLDYMNRLLELASNSSSKYNQELQRLVNTISDTTPIKGAIDVLMEFSLSMANIQKSAQALIENLKITEAMDNFKQSLQDIRDMLLGGQHPLAPQYPSYEVMAAAKGAGVSEADIFKMNRYQQQLIQTAISKGYLTLADKQKAEYQKRIALVNRQNQLTFRNVQRQVDAGMNILQALRKEESRIELLAKANVEGAPKQLELLREFIKKFESGIKEAYTRVGTTPEGGIVLKGFDAAKLLSDLSDTMKKNLADLGKTGDKLTDEFKTKMDAMIDPLGNIYKILNDHMVRSLDSIETNTRNLLLFNPKDIVKGVSGVKEYQTALASVRQDLIEALKNNYSGKAIGGVITGPGGPRDDKVPILASPGEYVIKADSVKKIGKQVLDYINSKGELPETFQSGGVVNPIEWLSKKLLGVYQPIIPWWKEKLFGYANKTGDTFSLFESMRRLKQHNKRITQEFAAGGVVSNLDRSIAELERKLDTVPKEYRDRYYNALKRAQESKDVTFSKINRFRYLDRLFELLNTQGPLLPKEMVDRANKHIKNYGIASPTELKDMNMVAYKTKKGQLAFSNLPEAFYAAKKAQEEESLPTAGPTTINVNRYKLPIKINKPIKNAEFLRPNFMKEIQFSARIAQPVSELKQKQKNIVGYNIPKKENDTLLGFKPDEFFTKYANILEKKRLNLAYESEGFLTTKNFLNMLKSIPIAGGEIGLRTLSSLSHFGLSKFAINTLINPRKALESVLSVGKAGYNYVKNRSLSDILKDIGGFGKGIANYYWSDIQKGGTRITGDVLAGLIRAKIFTMHPIRKTGRFARNLLKPKTKIVNELAIEPQLSQIKANDFLDIFNSTSHNITGKAYDIAAELTKGGNLNIPAYRELVKSIRLASRVYEKFRAEKKLNEAFKAATTMQGIRETIEGVKSILALMKGKELPRLSAWPSIKKLYDEGRFKGIVNNTEINQLNELVKSFESGILPKNEVNKILLGHVNKLSKRIPESADVLKRFKFGPAALKNISRNDIKKIKLIMSQTAAYSKLYAPFRESLKGIHLKELPMNILGRHQLQSIGKDVYSELYFNLPKFTHLPAGMVGRSFRHEAAHLQDLELRMLHRYITTRNLNKKIPKIYNFTKLHIGLLRGLSKRIKTGKFELPMSKYGKTNVEEAFAELMSLGSKETRSMRQKYFAALRSRELNKFYEEVHGKVGYIKAKQQFYDDILKVYAQYGKKGRPLVYAEGGLIDQAKTFSTDIWDEIKRLSKKGIGKLFGKATQEGETFSAPEIARRLKERKLKEEELLKEITNEKRNGGIISRFAGGGFLSKWEPVLPWWKNWFKELLFGKSSLAAKSTKALTGQLTKRRIEEELGTPIEEYSKGTSYVPKTQLAIVHEGEAIIPSKYNVGGIVNKNINKFALGGVVGGNTLTNFESAAEKIGEIIAKKIADVDIELKVPKETDLPKLEISNLDELKDILGTGAVGANKVSKLDQFIENTSDKLDRLEEQTVTVSDKVKEIETKTKVLDDFSSLQDDIKHLEAKLKNIDDKSKSLDIITDLQDNIKTIETKIIDLEKTRISEKEFSDLESEVAKLGNKIESLYTKTDRFIDSVEDKSYIDTKINEVISNLKSLEINPLKFGFTKLDSLLQELSYKLDSQLDIIYSNISRLGLV